MHQYTVAVVDDRSEIRVQLREYLETYEKEHRCILKTELFEDEVYVFTPKGTIKVLPKGANAIDFAYSIHAEIGHHG